jgi:hypothetical protein
MVFYKQKSLFRIIILSIYAFSSFIVLIINLLSLIKNKDFVGSAIIPISIITVLFIFLSTQLLSSIINKREIIMENDTIIVKSVFLKKRISLHKKSEIVISDFEKKYDHRADIFILRIIFKIFNVNTNFALLIKTDLFNRNVVGDLDYDTAVKLKQFIQSSR